MIKKLYKKGLSALLTLCLLFSFLPVMPVQAANSYKADALKAGQIINVGDTLDKGADGYGIFQIVYCENADHSGKIKERDDPKTPYTVESVWGVNEWKVLRCDFFNGGYLIELVAAPQKYTVTVKGGKAEEAEYAPGDKVNITANPPAKGDYFAYWEADKDDVKFEDLMKEETSFIMPARDVSVEAVFERIPTYKVTVNGGRTGDGQDQYAYGEDVPIIADVPDGSQFDKWTANVGGIVFEDASAATTTFGMPMGPVTITAIFKPAPVPPVTKYPVTVEGGKTKDGKDQYAPGETVTITAEDRDGGQFVNWTADNKDVHFTNEKAATTTFTMPASAVNITANFTPTPVPPVTEYPVTVEGGKADKGTYAPGETVTIKADELAGGQFTNWSTDSKDVTFADAKAATTTFKMPAGPVTVKANFKTAPVPPAAEYTVTVTNDGNGTAKAAPAKAQAGTKITLSATPKSGYHFKEWKVEKGGVTIAKDNTFTMPAADVTVKAVFEKTTTNPVTGLPMSGGETGAFALITLSVLLFGTTVLKRKADR